MINDLLVLLKSRTALVQIETSEEARVVDLVMQVLPEILQPVYRWSVTRGLKRVDIEQSEFGVRNQEPELALMHAMKNSEPSIYLLLDFHPYLKDPANVRRIRELALRHNCAPHTLILVSPELKLPPDLAGHVIPLEMELPDDATLDRMVREEAFGWSQRHDGRKVKVNRKSLDLLIRNLKGLTLEDARRLARNAIYADGAITDSDIEPVMNEKFKLLNRGGVLSYEYELVNFDDIAGLTRLKAWLTERKKVFSGEADEFGLDPPKGMLLLGVQGCGKSLAAKAVAAGFGVPLIRMDFGSLYNKFHGETERNLRESLKSAEVMAPCVLWMDEIEKGISVSDSDSGTSKRILGTLLTWMAEREAKVFMVATANDIESLPPELVRKGRFDEIFFVDLPKSEVRRRIFEIHLKKRGQDIENIDIDKLVEASDQFSGAEVEQAVVSSLYSAMAAGEPLNTDMLLSNIQTTRPLAVVMAEKIAYLRAWAAERCVPAD